MSADHDRNFIRTFLAVLGILFGITIAIIFAARLIMAAASPEGLTDARAERVAERTQPVFEVTTDPDQVQQVSMSDSGTEGGDDGEPMGGEEVYTQVCATCHDSGIGGAPRISEAGDWDGRLDKGDETLYDHAINGFNTMPAKGGNASLSDDEVKAAVDYMTEQIGG